MSLVVNIYKIQAFAQTADQGNEAGVVLLNREDELSVRQMEEVAKHVGASETAFVSGRQDGSFSIRYFTPACEIDLCGHATIASFFLMRQLGQIAKGRYWLHTKNKDLWVEADDELIWVDMGTPVIGEPLTDSVITEICDAYGLSREVVPKNLKPVIADVGIADIMFPVSSWEVLQQARQDAAAVESLSRRLNVVGVHMYCLSEDKRYLIHCSNYAPLYGIEEECATGTSNAGLTGYLYEKGLIAAGKQYCLMQGEHMGRPSEVYSKVETSERGAAVWIGGRAVRTGFEQWKEEK